MHADALRFRLKELLIESCDLDGLAPSDIDDHERLIRSDRPELDLTSLDAVEIASAIEYEFGVRIQDLSAAKSAFRSVDALAQHIATEKGW
jgi:acyl carrier protein